MVSRKSKTVKPPKVEELWKKEICDDCGHGKWNNAFWNLDIADRRPITIRCPFYKDGKYGIIRGSQACSNFIKKTCDSYVYNNSEEKI
jgi:hypothetical protein